MMHPAIDDQRTTPVTIRPCRDKDVGPLAEMLSHAFENDSAYRYMFLGAQDRRRGLRDFFARNLRLHVNHECTHVMVDRDGHVLATVTLRPPSGIHISTLTMIRYGLLPFALDHGTGAGAILHDHLPAEPLGQVRGDHATDDIVDAARRERHDDPNLFGRILLRGSRRCESEDTACNRE